MTRPIKIIVSVFVVLGLCAGSFWVGRYVEEQHIKHGMEAAILHFKITEEHVKQELSQVQTSPTTSTPTAAPSEEQQTHEGEEREAHEKADGTYCKNHGEEATHPTPGTFCAAGIAPHCNPIVIEGKNVAVTVTGSTSCATAKKILTLFRVPPTRRGPEHFDNGEHDMANTYWIVEGWHCGEGAGGGGCTYGHNTADYNFSEE